MRIRKRNGEHILTDITSRDARMLDNALSAYFGRARRETEAATFGTALHEYLAEELSTIHTLLGLVIHIRGDECEGRTCGFPEEDQDTDQVLARYMEHLRKEQQAERPMMETYSGTKVDK